MRALVLSFALFLCFNVPGEASYKWPLEINARWQEAILIVSDIDRWQAELKDIAGWEVVHEDYAVWRC